MGKKSNAKKVKKEETKKTAIEVPESSGSKSQEQPEPKTRQILIETNGVDIRIVKAEVSTLEMQAIFSNLLRKITGN